MALHDNPRTSDGEIWPLPQDRPLCRIDDFVLRVAETSGGVWPATEVVGSAGLLLAAQLSTRVSAPILYVVSNFEQAVAAVADARFYFEHFGLLSPRREAARVMLPSEDGPYSELHPDRNAAMAQMASLGRLAQDNPPHLFIVPAIALARRVVPRRVVREATYHLRVNQTVDRESMTNDWARAGYLRVPIVEDPGTFAVRGGIVDVWSPDESAPSRLELEGDCIVRIRRFSPDDQRTNVPRDSCQILPARANVASEDSDPRVRGNIRALCDSINWPSSRARHLADEVVSGRAFFGSQGFLPAYFDLVPLLEYFPTDACVVLEDVAACLRAYRGEIDQLRDAERAREGEPRYGLNAWMVDDNELVDELSSRRVVALLRSGQAGQPDEHTLYRFERTTASTPSFASAEPSHGFNFESSANKGKGRSGGIEQLVTQIEGWHRADFNVVIAARSTTQVERLSALLSHRGLSVSPPLQDQSPGVGTAPSLSIALGRLSRGVVLPLERQVFITEEEIFAHRAHVKKQPRQSSQGSLLQLRSLSPGDFVVHEEHGIGRYVGLERRQIDGIPVELIVVEYDGGKLFVPVYRLNQVQKHSAADGQPKLDRLGGLSFAKTKARVQRRLRQLADELLHLYSERMAVRKIPLAPADDDYATFEATFPFEETTDQAAAIADALADLESERVMDRLVCGDVGFGKTEIALRIAFRMAMGARQVAVLCPTTVLAQQHYLTFRDRLSDFGIEVRVLSRLVKSADTSRTLDDLKRGTVDVVIGTHRLLSKDVHFKNLGLLVIDEEQRFGVSHKERIKQLRKTVDVLTLSATPIPRTLQMAVGGLRELSVIETPPIDRRPIRTIIARFDQELLVEALRRELSRGGQVFYVYNRIVGLEERAIRLKAWVPEARIAVAHGQMRPEALEKTMLQFVSGQYDVLVSTAIVESGLDIPRANTMFIDRADLFGLSQLYQLRGRIGRSPERAYCYLLVPSMSELDSQARTRLETIERFTELGMGMRVAALDMEQRGAGDLLGAEQSGFVASVGFELFCRLLEDATSEAQGKTVVHEVEPDLTVDVEALIPEDYVSDVGLRLAFYKQMASATGTMAIDNIALELEDRFGTPPQAARNLLGLMSLKTALRQLKVLGCDARSNSVSLSLRSDTPINISCIEQLESRIPGTYRITPDSRLIRKARPNECFTNGIVHAEFMLAELEQCARMVTN